jgi:DNA-binding SARP family transcriptional activator/tRNA A-37 threonylcarbamoyl transferase component Bud32
MPVELKLLGGARVECDGRPIGGRAAHRRRLALLAILASAGGRFLGRERVLALLWPDSSRDAGRHLLSEALYVLRKEIDEHLITTQGDAIGIDLERLHCDVIAFRQAVRSSEWRVAVAQYAGQFLEGFYVDHALEFERWVDSERADIERDYGKSLRKLAEAEAAAGRLEEAAESWGRFAAHDPHNSEAVIQLMQALAAVGERGRALKIAGAYATRVRDDLGIEPDPEVGQVAERLKAAPESMSDKQTARKPSSPLEKRKVTELQDVPLAPEFEFVRPLGRGTMATVSLAREPLLGRLVAVKTLHPVYRSSDVARRRFEREARASARIHHPYVATIFRVGRSPVGDPYMVMPYVSGGTLEDRLAASGTLPVADAKRYLGQLAAGLAAAHRLGVIHRDVRPGNILYERETDRILLADFGIASVLDSSGEDLTPLTLRGERLGDPAYVSPEQMRGEAVTDRTDVYSLGLIAFELLTGRSPYGEEDVHPALLPAEAPVPRPSQFLAGIDSELDSLIHRCLNRIAIQRPFAADVEEALLI